MYHPGTSMYMYTAVCCYHAVLNLVYGCTVPMTGRKSRTLKPLAFDEYCRFDTSAFYGAHTLRFSDGPYE